MKMDHVGIAVRSIDAALPLWRDAMGAEVGDRETIPSQEVTVLFLKTGESCTELLEPSGEDSPIQRFIDKRGEGLHHIAYQVENLESVMTNLGEAGARLIYPDPRPGSHQTRINFIHPSSTGGILIELVEYPEGKKRTSVEEEIES